MAKLADKVGVQASAINKYEKGMVTNIPIERLGRIADALGVTTATLAGWGGLSAVGKDAYNPFFDDDNDAYGTDIEWRKRHGAIDDNPRLQTIVDLCRECDDATLDRIIAMIGVLK